MQFALSFIFSLIAAACVHAQLLTYPATNPVTYAETVASSEPTPTPEPVSPAQSSRDRMIQDVPLCLQWCIANGINKGLSECGAEDIYCQCRDWFNLDPELNCTYTLCPGDAAKTAIQIFQNLCSSVDYNERNLSGVNRDTIVNI